MDNKRTRNEKKVFKRTQKKNPTEMERQQKSNPSQPNAKKQNWQRKQIKNNSSHPEQAFQFYNPNHDSEINQYKVNKKIIKLNFK